MMADGVRTGLGLLFAGNPDVWSAVGISLGVSLSALILAACLAIPLGMWIGLHRFPGRTLVKILLQTGLSFPTVLLGLLLYGLLSRSGPLGSWQLLYTPAAMVLGQMLLAIPLLASLTIAAIEAADPRLDLTLLGLGAGPWARLTGTLRALAPNLWATLLVGFGRLFSEVGLSMMLGGNIRGYTRNITTAIALETSKGEFALGVALGTVLLLVALTLTVSAIALQRKEPSP